MCGIVGYKGEGDAGRIALQCLNKLVYRGYDSWGVCVKTSRLHFVKEVGKINKYQEVDLPKSSTAIAHTRWATSSIVSKINAHPHLSQDGKIAVVHNGIVENYHQLRDMLAQKGFRFISETDTEVIPNLIQMFMDNGKPFKDAVIECFSSLNGRSAIVVMHNDSSLLIGVRRGSPLIIGKEGNNYFIASDIPAFLDYTNQVMYIDDNEMAIIDSGISFFSLITKSEIKKRIVEIEWRAKDADKGSYEHFMLKEIMDQKHTVMNAINQDEAEIIKISDKINNAFGTFFVACGTAGNVCKAGEYLFSKIAKKHINFIAGSEFHNYKHFLTNKTLMIVVSQSGETADVLDAMEYAKEKGVEILAIVNVNGSSVARKAGHTFMINAGPEKAVASTKAATSQLALLTLIAYASAGRLNEGKKLLIETASQINDMLNPRYEEHIKNIAGHIYKCWSMFVIGRGVNYPIALEAALKIKEVSYIHAEGMAGGELKHGTLALINQGAPCIVLAAHDENKHDIINDATEIKARGGMIIGISPERDDIFDYWIKVPDCEEASAIANIIPAQIMAYHLALLKKCEIDTPRNLAKAVSVK